MTGNSTAELKPSPVVLVRPRVTGLSLSGMSNPIGPGDPTEPHGIPAVTPPPGGPPTSEQPVVDPTRAMPPVGAYPVAGGYPPGGYPPVPGGPGGPGDSYGDEPKRSITGWVIGGIVLAALLGLIGGAVWAATSKTSPTPTPSTSSSSASPTHSSTSPRPTRTPTPTPTKTPTPTPTKTTPAPQPTTPPLQNGPVSAPTRIGPPIGEARP